MEDNYEAHIRRIKEVVPEERLLIWNIKEGWEPLCKFLGKPVPNIPIPVWFLNFFELSKKFKHDNKTGDIEYMQKYFQESAVGKEMFAYMKWHFAKFLLKSAVIGGALIYEKKNDFRITKSIFSFLRTKLQL